MAKHIFIGYLIGVAAVGFVWIVTSSPMRQCEIRTEKKLTPDWELVVKGKTVDTVYVYKSERR